MDMDIQKEIEKLHNEKEYRPVVVLIIKKADKFLIVQSAKGTNPWVFPQGGIDFGETPKVALFREIEEEVSILEEELNIIDPLFYYTTKDAPITRKDKRGFSKGKAYFFSFCEYIGDDNLTLQEEELLNYHWGTIKKVLELLQTARKEKREMTITALKKLGIL